MEIALIVLSVLTISFLVAYVSVSSKLNSVSKGFAQLFIAHNTLRESLEGAIPKADQDIHKENFIKFLSDSRDWAYEYIENVQGGLTDFIKEIDPIISRFDEYGIVVEGSPHYKDMKIISSNFKKLKQYLPESTDDRR